LYNSTPNTLIIGKKVIYLPTCHSTNDIAAEIVHAGLFAEGTVVITDNQVKGRGQRGTTWLANAGENLTFSVILTPGFLAVNEQFLLSQTIALAIRAYLGSYVTSAQVKWPNDIYLNGKKACGILIENAIQGNRISHSIIGMGININQLTFENSYATSLGNETGGQYILPEEFQKLAGFLDAYYLKLRSQAQLIREEYLQNLFGYNEAVKFVYQEEVINGTVTGVTPQGKICVKLATEDEILEFGLKEIEWVKE
jgi:BirA family transcriptional regulator, biotin operon repressor / biotin---[acetyl-CoA-carboxylase] ligase